MRRKDGNVEEIGDLAGLSRTNPVMASILTILMFSLAGIPPLAGFFAKWYVFLAAIDADLYALAVIGVLASVVGAYYYLRIIKIMWFDEPVGGFVPMAGRTARRARRLRRLRAVLCADRRPDRRACRGRRQDVLLTDGFRLAPTAASDGFRLEAHRRRSARPTRVALERARAGDPGKLWVVSQAAGERARPARPRLGDARRAISRRRCCSSADCRAAACRDARLRRRAGARRRARRRACRTAASPSASMAAGGRRHEPLRAEMAERRAGRRRQARRHPARIARCSTAAAARWRSASASMSWRIPTDLPYPATSLRALGADGDAETLFLALSDAWSDERSDCGTRAAGLPRSAALAGAGCRARRARSRCASTAMWCAACSRRSTRTAAS